MPKKQVEAPEARRTLVAVLSDTHCGSPVGLMKPQQFQGKNGNISPTRIQRKIWYEFERYAARVKELRQGCRLIVVHNGDATEGTHHQTHQVSTNIPDEMERMHLDAMEYFLNEVGHTPEAGDKLFYVEGTEAHVRKAMQAENRIAKDLGAVPPVKPTVGSNDGWFVWPELPLLVNGVYFHIAHHPPVGKGRKFQTEPNALRSHLVDLYIKSIEFKRPLPRYWLRSHKHSYVEASHRGRHGRIDGFILPAWQAKTEFVYRIGIDEPASVGGWLGWVDPDGRTGYECDPVSFDMVSMERV